MGSLCCSVVVCVSGEVQLVGWRMAEVVELQVGELSSVVSIFARAITDL